MSKSKKPSQTTRAKSKEETSKASENNKLKEQLCASAKKLLDVGKSGEMFGFLPGEKPELGREIYTILEVLERQGGKDKLLVSYTAKDSKGNYRFIKTSSFFRRQPLDFSRSDLDDHHARFRKIAAIQPLFRDVEGAAPKIIDVGIFRCPRVSVQSRSKAYDKKAYIREEVELDYLVSEFVGHVDLVTYLTGEQEEIVKQHPDRNIDLLADHFGKGVAPNGYMKRECWRSNGDHFPGLKPKQWYSFANELVKNLKRLHNHGLIHGQLSPHTVRVTLNSNRGWSLSFIDFEESQQLASAKSDKEKADETDDITGLGSIIFYLACGKDWREVRSSGGNDPLTKTQIQEMVAKAVWSPVAEIGSIQGLQENIHFRGISKIIDKCLREEGGDREAERDQYLCCEDIAEELAIFGTQVIPEDASEIQYPAYEDLLKEEKRAGLGKGGDELLVDALKGLYKEGNNVLNIAFPGSEASKTPSFFHAIWSSKIQQLGTYLETLSRNHYEVHGDREELIDHLTRSLAGLQEDDIYLTLTRPSYWSQQNLGSHGRFFSMNQIMAVQKKVHTIRLFMLNEGEEDMPGVQKVLDYHREFHKILKRVGQFITTKDSLPGFETYSENTSTKSSLGIYDVIQAANSNRPIYYTGISVVPEEESVKDNALRITSKHVALVLSKKTKTCVTISFHDHLRPFGSHSSEFLGDGDGARRIHKVRFTLNEWDPNATDFKEQFANEFMYSMDYHLNGAKDLDLGVRSPLAEAVRETTLKGPENSPDNIAWRSYE